MAALMPLSIILTTVKAAAQCRNERERERRRREVFAPGRETRLPRSYQERAEKEEDGLATCYLAERSATAVTRKPRTRCKFEAVPSVLIL